MKNQKNANATPRVTATKLETASEMYKFAFQSKKHQLAKKFPLLSEKELHQKTVAYFAALPQD